MRNILITLFAFCITANAQESVDDSLEIQNLEMGQRKTLFLQLQQNLGANLSLS